VSFKICVIGCGGIVQSGHGPSYVAYKKKHPNTVLAGCCDIDKTAAQHCKNEFGFLSAYTDYHAMLNAERPDVVCVITPVHATKKIAVDVLKKGYPVLLEKPPGLDAGETREIIQAARETGLSAFVAFNRRYMPLLQALKQELLENPNPITHIDYMFVRMDCDCADFSTTAIHGIDAAKYLAGSDYNEVAFLHNQIDYFGNPCFNTTLSCKFTSGATGTLTFLPTGGSVIERVLVTASDATYFLELPVWNGLDMPGRLVCTYFNKPGKIISGDALCGSRELFITNGFYGENEAFFDKIKTGDFRQETVSSGLQSVEIAEYMRARRDLYVNGATALKDIEEA